MFSYNESERPVRSSYPVWYNPGPWSIDTDTRRWRSHSHPTQRGSFRHAVFWILGKLTHPIPKRRAFPSQIKLGRGQGRIIYFNSTSFFVCVNPWSVVNWYRYTPLAKSVASHSTWWLPASLNRKQSANILPILINLQIQAHPGGGGRREVQPWILLLPECI